MNWTEGSLARHSRGRQRNALITRQKQHFARARSGLLDTRPKRGPVSISFLSSDVNPDLASCSPRPVPNPRSHDYLSSTPPLPPSSREARQQLPIRTPDDRGQDIAINFDRRKKLLEKSDWAGLKLQEPLNITFPAHDDHRRKPFQRSSMRIQIGSQEVQPSIETSPQTSTKRYTREVETLIHPGPHASKAGSSVQSAGCREYEYPMADPVDTLRTLPPYLDVGEPPANVVYSATELIEPTPVRYLYSQTQQWFSPSSEDGESMQVKIERPVQLVPRSQKLDNKKWKDWVIGEQSSDLPSDSIMTATSASGTRNQGSESSLVTLPPHFRPELPPFRLFNEPEVACRHTSPELSSALPQESIGSEIANESPNTEQAEKVPVEKCSNPLPSVKQRIPSMKKDDADDLNEIWRKFANGDDEDSDELTRNAIREAAHQAAVELRPSDTSESAGGGTETAATCGTELSSTDRIHNYAAHSMNSELSVKGTTCSESAPSAVATAGSSIEPPFKPVQFVVPKAFAGRYVDSDQTSRVRRPNEIPAADSKRGKRKRRKKMASDGRTDIRSLPDIVWGPIEEIEG
ncbi:hypothetical protein NPX13_g6054 [Xylaria arbuscula]|uniref:Uncharacterized protein n=1 Tax=Xylaria arbuscula TaxID=114810 RepID=A0A9W8NCJ9_9PEZI|nr:hypothetical protein NPX13_g6054 [Xylaria arbuscula]